MDFSLAHSGLDWFAENVPCRQGCPAGTDIPTYIEHIARGEPEQAYAVNKHYNLLPLILGRVCAHPCEVVCRRARLDSPVAICALKRYAADQTDLDAIRADSAAPTGKRVAVIGAGPVGLTAAYDLAVEGHAVDVYEAAPVVGGMLHLGIPSYRMPRELLEKEVDILRRAGVRIHLDTPVGDSVRFEALRRNHDAVLIGVGAHRGMELDLPGAEGLDGFIDAVDFLRDVNLGMQIRPGSRVVVVGGGNSAIDTARVALRLPPEEVPVSEGVDVHAADAARSALRLGTQQVEILYRRTREEMPAAWWEVDEAEHEGVQIHYLTAPVRLLGDEGRVAGIECIRMELLEERDRSGRRRVRPLDGSEFTISCDVVVAAISQKPELSFLTEQSGVNLDSWGLIEADPDTCETSAPGVFAGGDVVTGPGIVIEAIAAGHRAAQGIDSYLKSGRAEAPVVVGEPTSRRASSHFADPAYARRPRQTVPSRPVGSRLGGFDEVELGYDRALAEAEASRCLGCHDNIVIDANRCVLCGGCSDVCPYGCIHVVSGARVEGLDEAETTLLVLDEDLCIRCGSCVRRCPTDAIFMMRIRAE